MRWNNWVLIGLGVWSILSPWILGFSKLNLVVWNSIFIGALVVVLFSGTFLRPGNNWIVLPLYPEVKVG